MSHSKRSTILRRSLRNRPQKLNKSRGLTRSAMLMLIVLSGTVGIVAMIAIVSKFPGKVDFKGRFDEIHLQYDGGAKE